MNNNRMQEKQRICEEIWNLARSALIQEYPFFRTFLAGFDFRIDEQISSVGCDGKHIYYQPDFLISCYRDSEKRVEEIFLHMLYHCLFLHMVMEEKEEKYRWNYACDLAVERIRSGKRGQEIWPQKIYEELTEFCEDVSLDDHRYWKNCDVEEVLDLAQKQWNMLAKYSGAGVGGLSDNRGNQAGNKVEKLTLRKPGTYDFRSYLRRYAVAGEEMETDTESFDYIPYLYGLEHYGNMPLIEHLEYREIHKLEELVIAVDTSGSCSADTVRRFMEETYGILSNHENFFRKMNVYILQCDFQIQHVAHITSEEEWKKYMQEMEIHGRSGTDFRPVFDYVEELKREKKLKNLKGLFYFTDGDGIYPEKATDYETAFVFYKEKSQHQKVPTWTVQLTLEDEL